ncbi:MAG: hypothetical protein HKN00_00545 [Flavobacteriaceae bacterium]|nr:hypothetical protein [Flavobacteriaceae bacterium]NNL81495.1 hypothetical protein [Flavobacteriaceae bacterium]
MKIQKFFLELRRRHVLKSIIAYLAISWVVIQIASIVLPAFNSPDYSIKVLIIILSIGLIFWTGFSWVYDLTPSGFQKTEDILEEEETKRITNRRLNQVIVGALFIAVLLLISISFWAGSRWQGGKMEETSYRVAVLPFKVDNQETEDIAHLKTGLTEGLITELSKVDALTVLGLASTELLNSDISPANILILTEIKRIDYFIHGDIVQNSDNINVQVSLKKALGETPIWQKNYTKDLSEVRSLLASIASDLALEMGITVKPEDAILWSGLRPVKPETYGLYLKGQHLLNQATPNDWRRGLVYLEEAIDRSPADTYAWSGLAEGYINLGHGPAPVVDVYEKALEAAKRAIELDSLNAEGWASLAHYHTYFGWDWELAQFAFDQADELNPNMAYNHFHRSWYLILFGDMNEAIIAHQRAQDLDPFTPIHTIGLAEIYRYVGDYDKALEEIEKVDQMNDQGALGMAVKGLILFDMGQEEEGLEVLKTAAEINAGWRYWAYGPTLARFGRYEEAQKIAHELKNAPKTAFGSLSLGLIYSEMGEVEKAVESFRFEHKHGWYPWIGIYVNNQKVKEDPRFIELFKEMKLTYPLPLIYDPDA